MKKIIIGIVILLVVIMLLNHPKLNNTKTATMHFTPEDGETAIHAIRDKKGTARAALIEQMLRLETAHFTSGQYIATGTAGMEVGKWSSLPKGVGDTTVVKHDPILGERSYIVWPSVTSFAFYLSDYIDRFNGNFAHWNAGDDLVRSAEYEKRVKSIIPKFINT